MIATNLLKRCNLSGLDCMPKLPRVSAKKLLKILTRTGFEIIRSKGSHFTLLHDDGRITTVPRSDKEIPLGTLHSILKDVDMAVEELVELL